MMTALLISKSILDKKILTLDDGCAKIRRVENQSAALKHAGYRRAGEISQTPRHGAVLIYEQALG